jgi:hypothetical protein
MCGSSGRQLFPNEPKHSKAVSYPVIAARYNINKQDEKYTLYGVIRYKHKKECSMTVKKLEAMVDDKEIQIKVTYPTNINNNRHHRSIHDLDDMLYPIIDQNCYGSDLQKFYLDDK